VIDSPPELLRSLDAQLDLEERTKPARHRTLRAAIRWSYELLEPNARDLFERLSVFRGGFGASGARAVAGSRSIDAARLLHELRDQSLVHAVPCDSEPRFDFFESVRDLAAERLALRQEVERDAKERHAAFVAELAQAVLEAPATDAPVGALVRERDNVLAALAAVGTTDPERALLLAVATDCAAGTALPIGARVLLLDEALRRATPRVARALVARALAVRGRLAVEANQTARGVRDLERARVVARRSGARAIEEYVVGLLPVALLPGSLAAVRRALAVAEKLARGPSRPGRSLIWAHVAVVHHELGDLAAAERAYARALAVADAEGQTIVAARMRARLGRVYVDAGRLDDADDALSPALAALAGDRFEPWARAHVALLAWKRGHLDDAREGYTRAVELFGVRGAVAFEVCNRTMLASVLAALGRGVDALAEIERARIDAAPLKDAGLDAGLALAEAHRALLDARRGGAPARVDLARARRRALRDKDVRALLERLDAMRTADLPTRPGLAVASDGAWFTPPDGHRAVLPAGSPLRAIVRALTVASERTSTSHDLVAAAWPAERILPRAAAHRLHAAMSELRALGLGRCVERSGDGYRLLPGIAVRVEG